MFRGSIPRIERTCCSAMRTSSRKCRRDRHAALRRVAPYPQCESDAYVWALKKPDDTLKLYFAVENPSGVSAKALAAILDKTLSGL